MTNKEWEIERLKIRIELLEGRPTASDNKNIVKKLRRKLRQLEESA